VLQSKLNRLQPIGLLMLGGGLLLRIWTKGDYSESAAGFLIGVSIVFIVVGFARRWPGATN